MVELLETECSEAPEVRDLASRLETVLLSDLCQTASVWRFLLKAWRWGVGGREWAMNSSAQVRTRRQAVAWVELSSGLSHTPIFGAFAPDTGRIEVPENHNAFGWDSIVLVSNRATKPAGGMCVSGGYRIRTGLLETFPGGGGDRCWDSLHTPQQETAGTALQLQLLLVAAPNLLRPLQRTPGVPGFQPLSSGGLSEPSLRSGIGPQPSAASYPEDHKGTRRD